MEEGRKIPDARNNRYGPYCLPLRHGLPKRQARPQKKRGSNRKSKTHVCIASVTKATKARNISLGLIGRRRRPTTTRSRLRDGRRRRLRRSDSRVHRSSHTQTGLSLGCCCCCCCWLARTAGLPMLGDDCCWFAKPNCRLLGRLEGPPLGI